MLKNRAGMTISLVEEIGGAFRPHHRDVTLKTVRIVLVDEGVPPILLLLKEARGRQTKNRKSE